MVTYIHILFYVKVPLRMNKHVSNHEMVGDNSLPISKPDSEDIMFYT